MAASDEEIKPGKFGSWAENHRTVFSTLSKHLVEAKYEHYVRGTEKEYVQEKLLIESMQVGMITTVSEIVVLLTSDL